MKQVYVTKANDQYPPRKNGGPEEQDQDLSPDLEIATPTYMVLRMREIGSCAIPRERDDNNPSRTQYSRMSQWDHNPSFYRHSHRGRRLGGL